MELSKINAVFTANKKDIEQMAIVNAMQLMADGNDSIPDQYCKARRLKEYLDVFCDNLKKQVQSELNTNGRKLTVGTDELQVTNGRTIYDYTADSKYWELSKKLASRKELLDFALKSSEDVFDSEGEQVEKLPVKSYGEDILSLKIR